MIYFSLLGFFEILVAITPIVFFTTFPIFFSVTSSMMLHVVVAHSSRQDNERKLGKKQTWIINAKNCDQKESRHC